MIRILHVVSSLNINAGMMSVVMNYYRRLDRNAIQFDFWYFNSIKDDYGAEIEALGGRAFYMPYRTFRPRDQKKIRAFFQEHRGEYAAVHCHPIWSSAVISREAKRSGIKHVLQHLHSTHYSDKKTSEIRNRILMRFSGLYVTDYLACNSEAAALFGKRRANNGTVFILPNAIEVGKYRFDRDLRDRMRAGFDADRSTLLIGNVGRLSPEKNQCFLVEIFQRIREKRPDAKLIIVGDGSLRETIENRSRELNLDGAVILTGRRRDIPAILSCLDLFLMPSLFEGTPVSAIEARSAGLPCLLSDSITRSVEMEGVRFLSLKESPEQWAEAALRLWDEWKDHDRNDYGAVVDNGFDIRSEAFKLQEYYMKLG